MMTISLLITLLLISFALWCVVKPEHNDRSAFGLLLAVLTLVQLALMFPEQAGNAVIVTGLVILIGLFAGLGVMVGQRLTHSFKTSED